MRINVFTSNFWIKGTLESETGTLVSETGPQMKLKQDKNLITIKEKIKDIFKFYFIQLFNHHSPLSQTKDLIFPWNVFQSVQDLFFCVLAVNVSCVSSSYFILLWRIYISNNENLFRFTESSNLYQHVEKCFGWTWNSTSIYRCSTKTRWEREW